MSFSPHSKDSVIFIISDIDGIFVGVQRAGLSSSDTSDTEIL